MLTKRNTWVIVSMRFKFVRIPILLPLRCLEEVAEGFCDITRLFRCISKKAHAGVSIFENVLMLLRDYGPLDLVNVDVASPDGHVKIKILLR